MLGAPTEEESISGALEALGCYRRRDEAIRAVFPDYEPDWKHKLVRSPPSGGMIVFSVVVERPDATTDSRRMPPDAYRAMLAATNLKQRVRKVLEYTWADRLGYAVVGTPNLLEYDQGFFVKGGDGLADVKPIAGLYKTQVFALAHELGLPEGIATRAPTTETFSLEQSQEEFYFGFPHEQMDLLLWGEDADRPAAELAELTGLDPETVEAGYSEIRRRRTATSYLHAPATLIDAAG
jgi:NAD+ synthase